MELQQTCPIAACPGIVLLQAQRCQPSIIFFDEIDGLAPVSAWGWKKAARTCSALNAAAAAARMLSGCTLCLPLNTPPSCAAVHAPTPAAGAQQQAGPDPQLHCVDAAGADGWAGRTRPGEHQLRLLWRSLWVGFLNVLPVR